VSRLQIPLYLRILGWLALNLLLVAAMTYAFAARDQSGLNMLLTEPVRERVAAVAHDVAEDVDYAPRQQRGLLLKQLGARYGAQFFTRDIGGGGNPQRPPPPFAPPNAQAMPPPLVAPGMGGPLGAQGMGAAPAAPPIEGPAGPPAVGGPRGPRGEHIEILRAGSSPGYNVIVRTPLGRGGPPHDVEVLAHTSSLPRLLMFLGIGRTLVFIVLVLAVSALLWWPFAWQVTRSIRELLSATRRMSQGRLETRVSVARRDEIGQLAAAINTMAEHLQGYLQGQRQFIADVAHEVVSPLARMQIGLGILEAHVPQAGAAALRDVHEDLEQMAEMLEELLLFSRSSLDSNRTTPGAVALASVVSKVVEKEAGDAPVSVQVGTDLRIVAYPPLIERALSNLVRNARRYASKDGNPIEIIAQASGSRVKIAVRDRGPGVPASALARLGEPFFRPQIDRARATGGFGLGLAIVRRCTEVNNGQVAFRNRDGGGFEAELDLPSHTA